MSKNNDITALSKEDLIQEVMQLKHQVSLLQKMVFGPKSDRFKLPADIPEINKFIASQTALGRVGRADDIGSVVAFLCSEDAKWVTAQRLEASGGMFI